MWRICFKVGERALTGFEKQTSIASNICQSGRTFLMAHLL